MSERAVTDRSTPRPTATVVKRENAGGPELVIVCERCEDIRVIDVEDAMRAALDFFLTQHDAERHSTEQATA